jgi:uncharacterized protein
MTTLYALVTGPSGSGKSQLLYALGDPDSYQIDEQTGNEYRHLVVDESLDVYLYCEPDPYRFDTLLDIPQRDLLGYIVMVDSTDSDTWEAAQFMMNTCRGYALMPTVIAANKQDLEGAATPERIGASLGMESMTYVFPCVASDPEIARNLFLQLLYSVSQEIERLDALIAEIERLAAEGQSESQGE